MNTLYADSKAIEKWRDEFGGIFTVTDLRNLFAAGGDVGLHRRIKRLLSCGALRRFCRSVYVTEGFSLEAVSCRLNPESYVTCGNVLSRNLVIGSIPSRTVTAAKPGHNRQYASEFGQIIQLGIAPHLVFGVEFSGGVRRADAEKALLDTLYFHQKGHRFSFDVYSDINQELLDMSRIEEYLSRYRNPRFVKFVENVLNA